MSTRCASLFPILGERLAQAAGTLSGGEQQQLALARALMSHPKLLMLDEPSLGLAPALVDHVFKLVTRLHRQGMTILLVEQNVHQTHRHRRPRLRPQHRAGRGCRHPRRSASTGESAERLPRRRPGRGTGATPVSPASETVTFIVNWLSLGSLYALMALGLVIVYGILRLVNFAYGELIMVAGYTLYLLGGGPLPWLVMAAVAVAAAVVSSYLTERVAFRPVREKSLTAMLITSFAVSTLLQNAALLFVSPRARVVPLPDLFSDSIAIGGTLVPVRDVLAIVVSLAMLALFSFVLRKTILGIALRAAADKFTMTRMLGVPANLIISTAFAISGLLAGIVSLFWLRTHGIGDAGDRTRAADRLLRGHGPGRHAKPDRRASSAAMCWG